MRVCVEFHVCVCSCEKKIERNNQRKREGAVRGSTKVEEEAALREAAPIIGIGALLIRGGDDGAGGYGGRCGAGRRQRLRRW